MQIAKVETNNMSSDGEYMPDDEEADASSSVSSDEESSDFIASDDDESNDDVSYHQPPELSEEEDCNTRIQHDTTQRKARQCTKQTNEKMHQMLEEEELSDEDLFGSDNDTQDMNLCASSSKLGVPSSQYQYSTPARNRGTRRKCTEQTNEKMHQMLEEEDLSDEEVFGSEDDVSPLSNLGALSSSQYVTPTKTRGKRRKCTKRTNEKMSQMLQEEGMDDEEVFGSDTQDMGRNLLGNLAPSKQNKLSTKHNSRRKRKRNSIVDSDINNGGILRKRGKGSCKDSVFVFHGTSSEEEDNQLPTTRSSKKSRRSKRITSDGGNDHEGMGSLSRGSLQNELYNEFDIDSSDGIESIEHENQSSNQDEGESSEEPNNKVHHLMGSKDLYCCPLCYAEAYRRQGNLGGNMDRDDSSVESESSSDGSNRKVAADPFLFSDDPMTILTNIGLERAATFCFETLGGVDKYVDMGVKDHMEIIHGIDSSALVDNELFQRFKIRDGDSLLQRWLRRARAGTPGQMDMQDYWLRDGNNDQFNHLARMVHKIHRQMMHSGEFAWETFSESFPNRAKKLWNKLSNPHLRQHNDDDDSDSGDMDDDEDIEQEEYKPPPVLPGDEESDAEEYIAQHLPNLSDPVRRERYSQELQEERDVDNSSSDENEDEEGVDSHVSDEAASNNISFLASDHSNNCDFVAMADGTWKPKDDEDSISSLSKEENESGEESDSSEEDDSADESSKEEPDEWMKERIMKPKAARQKERSIRQNDNSSNSDEDDSLRPSHISPDQAELGGDLAELGGDLVDTDDELQVQPRQLEYSPEKKKRKRILDDSDDES